MKKYLAILLMLSASLFASNVILFDPMSSPITNRVTGYLVSVDTPAYLSVTNALLNPVLPSNFLTNQWNLYKVSNGLVIQFAPAEWTSITNAQAAAQSALIAVHQTASKGAATNTVENFEIDGRLLRALAEVMMDEINIIRTNMVVAMTPRTIAQLKAAIKNKIAAQPDSAP